MDRILATAVYNLVDPFCSKATREFSNGTTIQECYQAFFPIPLSEEYEVLTFVNNFPLTGNNGYSLKNGDYLTLAVAPRGGGSGKALQVVAMLALAYATWGVGSLMAAGAGSVTGAMSFVGATGLSYGTIGAMGIAGLVAGYGMNLALDMSLPTSSPTYNWEVASSNSDREGVAWSVLYGTHRITPPLIAKNVSIENGDKQYLNLLFAIAEHSVDGISDIEVDQSATPTQSEDLSWAVSLGAVDQPGILGFNTTHTFDSIGENLTGDWITRTVSGNAIEGLTFSFTCPAMGFFKDDGSLGESGFNYNVQYRKIVAGQEAEDDWIDLATSNILVETPNGRWSKGHWWTVPMGARGAQTIYPAPDNFNAFTPGQTIWVAVEIGDSIAGKHVADGQVIEEGGVATVSLESWLVGVVYLRYGAPDPIIIPAQPLTWHWETEESISHESVGPDPFLSVRGAQTTPLHITHTREHLQSGSYQVRARFHTVPDTNFHHQFTTMRWNYVDALIYDNFTYPGCALLSVKILASSQHSGGIPLVTCKASRNTVRVWTGAAYEDKPATNPAWVNYDMLHNDVYGAGKPYTKIVFDDFSDYAANCTEAGYTCNIYFDSIRNFRQALDMVSLLGRARVVQRGSNYSVVVDKVEDTPVQGFMFTPANIIKDSLTEEWLPYQERPNLLEVFYYDKDNRYKRTSLCLPSATYETTAQEIKRQSVDLIGCDNRIEALKALRNMMNKNRLISYKPSWSADIDAIGCIPGDIVELTHDTPEYGQSGRVVSTDLSGIVTVDRDVVLEPGDYWIKVQHAEDDSQEIYKLAPVNETTTTRTIALDSDSWNDPPCLHDLYSVGPTNKVSKLVRISSISKNQALRRRIQAIEYIPCSDDDAMIEIESPSLLTGTMHLAALEIWRGGSETNVHLSWGGQAVAWNIWSQAPGQPPRFLAKVYVPFYEIRGLDYGVLYTFHVSHTGRCTDGAFVDLTLMGKITPPGDVGTVSAIPWEDGCTFRWNRVTDFDLVGYRARSGVHWTPNTLYEIGDVVVPTDGTEQRFIATTDGISEALEPSWPATGTYIDGSVTWTEDSDNWAWENIADTALVVELSVRQMQIQGKERSAVRCFVVARDAFNNLSLATATAACVVLNQKPYLSVGVTTAEGTFDKLHKAIGKLPEGGGKIIIKNGTYQMTGHIPLPNKHLEIEGETQSDVVIKNLAGADLFLLADVNGDYAFRNFTIGGQAHANFTSKFCISGTTYSANKAAVSIERVIMNLQGNNDTCVSVANVSGPKIEIATCQINNCYSVIEGASSIYAPIVAKDNIVVGAEGCCFNVGTHASLDILRNKMFDIVNGITVLGTGLSVVDGNYGELRSMNIGSSSNGRFLYASVSAVNSKYTNNILKALGTENVGGYYWPFFVQGSYIEVSGNNVEVNRVYNWMEAPAAGIYLYLLKDSQVTGNFIKIFCSSTPVKSDHNSGIYAEACERNMIANNNIELTHGVATEIGIELDADCSGNKGSGNKFKACGKDISDVGTSNNINRLNGGTW